MPPASCRRLRRWARRSTAWREAAPNTGGRGSSRCSNIVLLLVVRRAPGGAPQGREAPVGVLLHGADRAAQVGGHGGFGQVREVAQGHRLALAAGQGPPNPPPPPPGRRILRAPPRRGGAAWFAR